MVDEAKAQRELVTILDEMRDAADGCDCGDMACPHPDHRAEDADLPRPYWEAPP